LLSKATKFYVNELLCKHTRQVGEWAGMRVLPVRLLAYLPTRLLAYLKEKGNRDAPRLPFPFRKSNP